MLQCDEQVPGSSSGGEIGYFITSLGIHIGFIRTPQHQNHAGDEGRVLPQLGKMATDINAHESYHTRQHTQCLESRQCTYGEDRLFYGHDVPMQVKSAEK